MHSFYKDFYNEHGWVLLRNVISNKTTEELRSIGIKLRKWVDTKLGEPSKYGPVSHWKGIGCAGMYNKKLLQFYQSDIMFTLASKILGTEDIWLFNDQMVIKLPGDNFEFGAHFDNQYGNENKDGSIHTVNIGVALDDFTDENGTIEVLDVKTDEWVSIYPKAGDILAINGNTIHRSNPNTSDKPRGLYACVYSEAQINLDNFYTEKFFNPIKL